MIKLSALVEGPTFGWGRTEGIPEQAAETLKALTALEQQLTQATQVAAENSFHGTAERLQAWRDTLRQEIRSVERVQKGVQQASKSPGADSSRYRAPDAPGDGRMGARKGR